MGSRNHPVPRRSWRNLTRSPLLHCLLRAHIRRMGLTRPSHVRPLLHHRFPTRANKILEEKMCTYVFDEEFPTTILKPVVKIVADFLHNIVPVHVYWAFGVDYANFVEEGFKNVLKLYGDRTNPLTLDKVLVNQGQVEVFYPVNNTFEMDSLNVLEWHYEEWELGDSDQAVLGRA